MAALTDHARCWLHPLEVCNDDTVWQRGHRTRSRSIINGNLYTAIQDSWTFNKREEASIMTKKIALFLLLVSIFMTVPDGAYAKSLFHATEKAVARRIMKRGFAANRMRAPPACGREAEPAPPAPGARTDGPASKAVVAFK